MGAWCTKDFRESTRQRGKANTKKVSLEPVIIKVTPPSPPPEKQPSRIPSQQIMEERMATLAGLDADSMRRASHSGFAAHRLVDLPRRPSMPVYLLKKNEEERKLHNSSACVNLIQEFTSMKVIGKDGSEHYIDENLQEIHRKLKQSGSSESASDIVAEMEIEVKKSSSSSDISKSVTLKDKAESCAVRKTNSDTVMGDMDIVDPERN